jgi:hypothetical protein
MNGESARAPKIIEIGPRPFVGRVFPDTTQFFSTDSAKDRPQHVTVLPALTDLWRALRRHDVDLVVCHPGFSSPWGPRHLNRALFSWRFVQGRSPLFRAIGPELLRIKVEAPIVVVDHEDVPFISRHNLALLDRCALWFKRELPVDRWRVFQKTAHANLPTPRFREKPREGGWVEKLRPLAIGLPIGAQQDLPLETVSAKSADIFFSGRVTGSSWIRPQGLAELKQLADAGAVKLDLPDAPLPRPSFYARCAAAWIVWSPEGLGWDCFRHYEAAAAGSVPLINQPTIERSLPLIAGAHALYYDPEAGGLARAIRAAIADRPAMARIAARARRHVLDHHTPEAIARRMVTEALGWDAGVEA